jgi:uncharacterized protein (PEP-CTERM system associated)
MDMGTGMDMVMKNNNIHLSTWLALIISCFSTSGLAQQSAPGTTVPGSIVPSGSVAATGNSSSTPNLGSEESGTKTPRAFVIKPRIRLTETWTDNVSISQAQNKNESGFITELAPGIHIDAKTARLKASFDYALLGQFYSTPSGYSRTQNQLNTFGTLEAMEKWLFVDFSAVIAQQAISAFGSQSPGSANLNNNLTETATYRLSPYIRGQLAGAAEYSLRYNRSTTQSNASTASDIELSEWTGQLRGSTPFQNLQWSANASQQTADYSRGRKTDAERLYATAAYAIVPQFAVSISVGRESNNYASADSESHTTHGYGFDWSPTERTKVSAFKDRRFFGDGHRFNITHRFPLSSISYSDTKDVSVLPNQFTSIGQGTYFDILYPICIQELSDSFPDPVQLAQECYARTNALIIQNGYQPNAQPGFLSSRASLQQRQQLAIAFHGVRNTLTILFNRNESQSFFASSALPDDFSTSTDIRQRGLSVNLSHRLTSRSNLNMLASRQESVGTGISAQKVTTTMYQANLTSKLGAKTTGGLSIRHTEFDSTSTPYTENALIGTISVVF